MWKQQSTLWIECKSGKKTNKTPHELWFGHSPIVKYFRIFGSKCYIKRDDDIGNFDARSDEGMFLGYLLKKMLIDVKIRKLRLLGKVLMWELMRNLGYKRE